MFKLDKIELFSVNMDYLKALNTIDSEVYYINSIVYENKPYVGVLVNNDGLDYIIPLTSAKNKHKNWKNVSRESYLIFEFINNSDLGDNDIYVSQESSDIVKKIISVLDIKKMIPVKEGLFTKIDIESIESTDEKYADLLNKEIFFLRDKKQSIADKANKIYIEQKESGVVKQFHCNFSALETVCKSYSVSK
ncbi:MAG: type III toxin-antitoxin system ToxN/AbiQ family toxin [Candidatus Izemoplasmatales bacterium]|nr:type III toxin-antitoxin system ToxN/AbiQ family toxin [Candidatus Izemoplasmatales bacterium]